jgi:hypothetical protein
VGHYQTRHRTPIQGNIMGSTIRICLCDVIWTVIDQAGSHCRLVSRKGVRSAYNMTRARSYLPATTYVLGIDA